MSTRTATSNRRGFRAHTTAEAPAAGSPRVIRLLLEEWTTLSYNAAAGDQLQAWASAEPALDGMSLPADLVDHVDEADKSTSDALLGALARLAQAGETLAGRIALQVMLPALSNLPRRCRIDAADADERWQVTIAAFFTCLDRVRSDRNVASRLALDTLHEVTACTRSRDAWTKTITVDNHHTEPVAVDSLETTGDAIDAESDLSDLLAWAVQTSALSPAEAQLLADSYLVGRRPTHGEHQLSEAARRRRSRARRKLIEAVRDHVTPPATGIDGTELQLVS